MEQPGRFADASGGADRGVGDPLLEAHRDVLGRIAAGEQLIAILDAGAGWIERQLGGAGCAILLVDRIEGLMRQVAAPSLVPGFATLVNGLRVGAGFGPWGAAAAAREPVVVADIGADASNTGLSQGLLELGVRSLSVTPLHHSGGDELIALIAVYRNEPHAASERELELVADIGRLLVLAIEHDALDTRARTELNIDPLTGTLNRLRFIELINDRLACGTPVAVICLEIDRFKQLRLTLGQHPGDQLLAEVGRRLLAVAGSSGLVGHFSGDEYGLMIEAPSEQAAVSAAREVVESFNSAVVLEEGEFFVSCSLGIAYSDGTVDAYGLVRHAAAAMHAARADGPGRQRIYDGRMAAQLHARVTREAELRRAIDQGEFVIHYQPLLRLADGVWDRAETLVRWQHPQRGLVYPGEFIPLAEECGLMSALGECVLDLVIAQAKLWALTLPAVQLSVNVSGMQLGRPSFGRRMLTTLERSGLLPAALLLEVTESALLQDIDAAHSNIAQLYEAGVRTAIDDFGTGFSSLARLGELPITGVKIDRAFVSGLGNDEKSRAIFAAITEIVRAHGLLVIAEGIEDERTLEEVVGLGCDFAQGYHLCRPAAAEQIEKVLAAPVPERLARAVLA